MPSSRVLPISRSRCPAPESVTRFRIPVATHTRRIGAAAKPIFHQKIQLLAEHSRCTPALSGLRLSGVLRHRAKDRGDISRATDISNRFRVSQYSRSTSECVELLALRLLRQEQQKHDIDRLAI